MKIIISPAKKLLKKSYNCNISTPIFYNKAIEIANKIKEYNQEELKIAFNCSEKLSKDAYEMYQNFNNSTHPALYLFDGLQYKNIDIKNLERSELLFLENNLLISDALYGLLRATDTISNYRLDFNSKFPFSTIDYYKSEIKNIIKEPFVNLCSKEYNSILPQDLAINISFIQCIKGACKSYSTHTKIERGKFVNYLAKEKETNLDILKAYNQNGYKFDSINSSKNNIIYKKHIS